MREMLVKVDKKIWEHKFQIAVVLLGMMALVVVGYWAIWADISPGWTGFGQRPIDPNVQSTKTLWDWMELLIVPTVLALGLYVLNQSARRNEQDIAESNRNQSTLEAYFDRMTELILDQDFAMSEDPDSTKNGFREVQVRNIARTRTLSVLRSLDIKRVEAVFQFINDAELEPFISLAGGNLRGLNWKKCNLWKANLQGAYLAGANLKRANLIKADLSGANLLNVNLQRVRMEHAIFKSANLRNAILIKSVLTNADFQKADLTNVNLHGAIMIGVNLEGSDLNHADLQDAVMRGVNLANALNYTNKQLMSAKSLEGAIMPDGTKYEEWVKKQAKPN